MRDKQTGVRGQGSGVRLLILIAHCSLLIAHSAFAGELKLQDLIDEALKNNYGLAASQAKTSTAAYRIPQAKSLPDPIVGLGYQNEGWSKYSYGEEGAQWMFSASQMFPYPGKLDLRGKAAAKESDVVKASLEDLKLKTIANVKGFYYDLFLAYKNIDIIKDRTTLFSRIEDAANARYSSGLAPVQEVVMAQTEKYMLLEKEEMQRQRIKAISAMLNATLARDINTPLGRPAEPPYTPFNQSQDELIRIAKERSPELKAKAKMVESGEVKVEMAKKEFYPDFTVGANIFKRGGNFDDMWSLTTAVNVPLYYKTKQQQGVSEANSAVTEARNELLSAETMISGNIGDSYSMVRTAEKLMDLYKNALIPKIYQDFELALAGYVTGKVEAITVITRLKALRDYETSYWGQFVEREKAIARIEALAGMEVAAK